jgi:hypothetical protein
VCHVNTLNIARGINRESSETRGHKADDSHARTRHLVRIINSYRILPDRTVLVTEPARPSRCLGWPTCAR